MSDPVIRLATDADGPAIGKLFAAAAYNDLGVDWHAGVAPWWLVAEIGGEIVGAINIAASKPYGFIGDCVVLPAARARREDQTGIFGGPGRVTLLLYAHALTMLRDAGSQLGMGVTAKPGLKRILRRYGAVSLQECELFAHGLGGRILR